MLGVDNITFWSATPGEFLDKKTGKDILKSINIKGLSGKSLFSGTQKQWNDSLIKQIKDLLNEVENLNKDSNIEILCSESVLNIISNSSFYEKENIHIDELIFNIKIVNINEHRIDIFLNKKFAGAINIYNL